MDDSVIRVVDELNNLAGIGGLEHAVEPVVGGLLAEVGVGADELAVFGDDTDFKSVSHGGAFRRLQVNRTPQRLNKSTNLSAECFTRGYPGAWISRSFLIHVLLEELRIRITGLEGSDGRISPGSKHFIKT